MDDIVSFLDARLTWDEKGEPGKGNAGHWSVGDDGSLTIAPVPGSDFWSRTFYTPLLIRTDGQSLAACVPAHLEMSLTSAFTYSPIEQLDQAGVVAFIDDDTWVKAGIEFVNRSPRLACVMTNSGFSDWSTMPWPHWDEAGKLTGARIRISKVRPGPEQGDAVLVDAAPYHPPETETLHAELRWSQVRIASVRPRSASQSWRMGVYSHSPLQHTSCRATFHSICLGPKAKPVHDAALPDGHGGLEES
jgi:hypothetical protein